MEPENDGIAAAVEKALANAESAGSQVDEVSDDAGAPPAPAPAKDTAKTAEPTKESGQPRDERGKFAPKPGDERGAQQAQQPVAASQEAPIPPPSNWKGNAKVNWQRLPREVQQALAEDYGGHTKASSELEEYRAALGDRAQILAAQYGSIGNGLKSILAGADMANKNPVEFIRWLAQRSGINLGQLGQSGGQGFQPNQPSNPLEAKIAQIEGTLNQFFQSQQQTQMQSLQAEISTFAADPSRPYFEDVRRDMAVLIREGRAKTMAEAYDKACWADPEIRKSLLAAERKREAEEAAAKVAAAKKANGSITGSPSGARIAGERSRRTLDDSVTNAVERALAS